MIELANKWARSFYTESVLLIVLLISLLVALRNRKRHTILSNVEFYITGLLFVYLSSYLEFFGIKEQELPYKISYSFYLDYLFTLLEFVIFFDFFTTILKTQKVTKLFIIIKGLFIAYFFVELFFDYQFPQKVSEYTQARVYTVEAIILLIPCILYFVEIFRTLPYLKLTDQPSFWITTGLFFFLICTLPYSLLENYLRKYYHDIMMQLYSIFYLFYILFFVMIIRAYLCKPVKTI